MGILTKLKKISDTIWELSIDYTHGMRVPGRIYATEALLANMDEGALEQISNVAHLPGIQNYALCMPDAHWGYGFPIGGVAAMDIEEGVISPGGIGFDINCGMRLVTTNLAYDDVKPKLEELVNKLFEQVPCGLGKKGLVRPSKKEFKKLIEQGAKWCVGKGLGWPEDLDMTEDSGCVKEADSGTISKKAIDRGYQQIGTLGSGNHYLEIQVAKPENIADKGLAEKLGINIPNQIVVMFHCGSRGFGHQVATDYLQRLLKVMGPKYKISVPDRQLACVPFKSQEGKDYFSAMNCAINMAFANRQAILHKVRQVFAEVFGKSAESLGMHQVYDVAHNTAKLETHTVGTQQKKLLVHRKGATRAFPPQSKELPEKYQEAGQPVIIGGSMETGSYLLIGTQEGGESFYSTAHGSGRTMSRKKAKKQFYGKKILKQMQDRGAYIQAASLSGLAEEAGAAYKDIDEVVKATSQSGLSKPVAKFIPVGNIKG